MARILVVDDEQSIRNAFVEFLRDEGHDAIPCPTAEEAMAILAKQAFDVVVSDIIMPRVTGIELLEGLKRCSKDLQVIMITGQPSVETAAEAVRHGAFDYLSKPLGAQQLIDVVNRAVKVKELLEENRKLTQANRLYQEELENTVKERTEELYRSNRQLEEEVEERQRAQEELENTVSTLRRTMHGTICAMALIVDKRDAYTAGHQNRVARLALAIARHLGLSENEIESIELAAAIHDVGKISVPAGILAKPARLNSAEYAIVKDHPATGAEILGTVEFPWPIAEIVHQHHERLDGSGYPRGLKGDAISLEGRILAVADVVEAMASHRPYRPSLGWEAALDEVQDKAGTLYDKNVVKACVAVFREKGLRLDD